MTIVSKIRQVRYETDRRHSVRFVLRQPKANEFVATTINQGRDNDETCVNSGRSRLDEDPPL